MYIGIPPFGQTVRTVTEKVAVQDQVDFYPDGGYLPGYIDVQMNGQSLLSTDFFATDGVKITLVVACNALDEFRSVAYWPVSLVDTYRKFEADAKFLQYYNGKAGVGTTTPQKLFVVSNSGANGIEISPDDAATSNLNRMLSYNRSTGAYTPMVFQGSEYRIYTKGGSADESVRVDALGNVGIGTSSPNYKLQVAGSTRVTSTYYDGAAYIQSNGSDEISVYAGGAERARFLNTGSRKSTVIGGGGGIWDAFDCRAWVNFNGVGTVSIRASGNVSSITDNGVGNFTANLSSAMPDTNYAAISSINSWACQSAPTSTTQVFVGPFNTTNGGAIDQNVVQLAIFR